MGLICETSVQNDDRNGQFWSKQMSQTREIREIYETKSSRIQIENPHALFLASVSHVYGYLVTSYLEIWIMTQEGWKT